MDNTSKVMIVGNNPLILEKNYGGFIDSYDIVIRINRCITKGLELHTGTKTNIWATTFNHNIENFIPNNFDELSAIWYRTPNVKNGKFKQLVTPPLKNQSTFIMSKNDKFKKNFPQYFENMKVNKSEFCTGLLTILTSTLFYKDVTIIGFDFFGKNADISNQIIGYYRNFELKDNKHYEDKLWNGGSKLVSRTINSKNKIIKELINTGKIKAVDYR